MGCRCNEWAACPSTGWQMSFAFRWHWKRTPTLAASTPGQLTSPITFCEPVSHQNLNRHIVTLQKHPISCQRDSELLLNVLQWYLLETRGSVSAVSGTLQNMLIFSSRVSANRQGSGVLTTVSWKKPCKCTDKVGFVYISIWVLLALVQLCCCWKQYETFERMWGPWREKETARLYAPIWYASARKGSPIAAAWNRGKKSFSLTHLPTLPICLYIVTQQEKKVSVLCPSKLWLGAVPTDHTRYWLLHI